MSYKTKPDEDEGFGDPIPVCREYTRPRANPRSRAYAAILGGKILGPVIEVQIVKKSFTNVDLKLQFHHRMKGNGNPV